MNKLCFELRNILSVCAVFLCSIFYTASAFSQCNPAVNDPSFNPLDQGLGKGDGTGHAGTTWTNRQLIRWTDDRFIIANTTSRYNGSPCEGFVVIDENGVRDSNFIPSISTEFDSVAATRNIKVQQDDKLVIGGIFVNRSGETTYMVRLNTDGSIDTSFSENVFEAGSYIYSIDIQADGKVLVAGYLKIANGVKHLVRLNNDGNVDASFVQGYAVDDVSPNYTYLEAVKVLDNGKILVAGTFESFNSFSKRGIVRLNSDGSVDNTFNVGGSGASGHVFCIAIQNDQKIIIGGYFGAYNGTTRGAVARLNEDGSLDMSFDSSVGVINSALPLTYGDIRNIMIQQDGKVIIGGFFHHYNLTPQMSISRLNSNGTLDNSFTPPPNWGRAFSSQELDNGKIILLSGIDRTGIQRLNSNGTWDNTFNSSYGFDDTIYFAKILSDGRIFVKGGGKYNNQLGRSSSILTNGGQGVDNSFKFEPATQTNYVIVTASNILEEYNQKFITQSNVRNIIRLNSDGTQDNSFNLSPNIVAIGSFGFGLEIKQAKSQQDGKIIISGDFRENINGGIGLARLHPNGSLDVSFTTSNNDDIEEIVVLPNDKVFLGGSFSMHNGNQANYIVKLNADGSIDNNFQSELPSQPSSVYKIFPLASGEIAVAGIFSNTNNTSTHKLVKLQSTGEVVSSFDVPVNGRIKDIKELANGDLLIVGDFTQVNSISRNHIAFLNTDGSLSTAYNVGVGANSPINSIVLKDDNIYLFGSFTSYNGQGKNRVTRLSLSAINIANITPPQNQYGLCIDTQTTLAVSNQGTVYWYDSPTSTTPIGIGDTLRTPILIQDSTYFYALDSVIGCGSSDRLELLVTTSQSLNAVSKTNYTAYLDATG
uniref:Ig-like domain-containing protein n=1 Tax=Bernardetia sp. TaxID=1937974 RepID=UPI0025B945EF